jgi:tetratricopeptide (TPR) repeat protein
MKVEQIVTILAILTMVAICVQPVAASADAATDYYNIAEQYISSGNYEKALEYFDKALASNTTMLSMGDGLMYTYKDRSAVLTDLGRYEEAIKAADLGIAKYPKEPGFWNNKGYAYFKMGKFNDAADAYGKAVTLDPKYLKGWINRGNALAKAGRAGEAVDAYNKALEIDPGNTDASAGIKEAQSAATTTNIVLAVIVLIGLAVVIWYVKFRKPGDEQSAGKGKAKK